MRRAVRWCWHSLVASPQRYSGGCRYIHHPLVGDQRGRNQANIGTTAPERSPATVTLNALSIAVRRFLEHSPGRWWEASGGMDTLFTILLDQQYTKKEGESGALHPLLCVEIMRKLGCSVWVNTTTSSSSSSDGCGGWARRSGLSAEAIGKLAKCVLQPLLPHSLTHPMVRPLLPVMVEWLTCISDFPLHLWLPQLSLYLDDLTVVSTEDASGKGPPPEFLLRYLAQKIPRVSAAEDPLCQTPQEVEQALDKMLQLLVQRQGKPPCSEGTPQNVSPSLAVADEGLSECLFWQGETPLLLHESIREAYGRMYHAQRHLEDGAGGGEVCVGRELHTVFPLPILDDDTFRRFLLRLLALSAYSESEKVAEVPFNRVVLVEPILRLEDTSLVLRLITPLSEFVTAITDNRFSSPLCLSFTGISTVIYHAIGELQRLQKCPNRHRYALLPHKPRIHTLKALCEGLLSDVQRKQQQKENQPHNTKSATFPGVPLLHQVQVLQSFCRATRRLVGVVMTQKTTSLLEEGPEGSALHAGGAKPRHGDLTAILRNTAYRVLETSLLRYYKALDEWSTLPSLGADDDSNDPVAVAVAEIKHHTDGRATLFTARHLLQHPMRQDVTAVVEGLRLVAIQALVLHSQHCEEWLMGNYNTAVAGAFFAVWHRVMERVTMTPTEEAEQEKEESHAILRETQRSMCGRLLWTMLLLHQRYCSCCASRTAHLEVGGRAALSCVLLRSLLELLTSCNTCTELASFGWPLPLYGADATNAKEKEEEEWQRDVDYLWTRQIVYPPSETLICGCSAKWELQEELSFLTSGKSGTWRWLGTTRAVRDAVVDAERGVRYDGYLLPWSTVAHSRHPLRFYDESGESVAAALAFDAVVESLLLRLKGIVPVLRVVSIAEEAMFFRDMTCTLELPLGSGVVVACPEALQRKQRPNKGVVGFARGEENDADAGGGDDDDDDDCLD
ncbi:hypothetical protein DQ04_00171100 [Trypanosoma grayi]|uniref:hypothetical protein n=1 Tax=Trypanosoma grayi TaxID=71804 RepID=UPI0004F45862|nr:hypothetical protein DQ04_00171100 [Trypanosoma grayi]KEG15146.1 hypothetical protein DQ04_00171100 [Trypanosoma grayi]